MLELTRSATASCASSGLAPIRGRRLHLRLPGPPLRAARRRRGRRAGARAAPRRAPPRPRPRRHASTATSRSATRGPSSTTLTPIQPERRIPLDARAADVLARAVDLLAPLASASGCCPRRRRAPAARRCCARSPRGRRGRTTAERDRAADRRAARGGDRLARGAAGRRVRDRDRRPGARPSRCALAELALERARRRAETGADVVLISTRSRASRSPPATSPRSSACSAPGANLAGRRLADRDRDRARRTPTTTARPSAR